MDAYCFMYRLKYLKKITCESKEMRNEKNDENVGLHILLLKLIIVPFYNLLFSVC